MRIEITMSEVGAEIKIDDVTFELSSQDGVSLLMRREGDLLAGVPHVIKKRDERKALLAGLEKALQIVTGA